MKSGFGFGSDARTAALRNNSRPTTEDNRLIKPSCHRGSPTSCYCVELGPGSAPDVYGRLESYQSYRSQNFSVKTKCFYPLFSGQFEASLVRVSRHCPADFSDLAAGAL